MRVLGLAASADGLDNNVNAIVAGRGAGQQPDAGLERRSSLALEDLIAARDPGHQDATCPVGSDEEDRLAYEALLPAPRFRQGRGGHGGRMPLTDHGRSIRLGTKRDRKPTGLGPLRIP
jgi:hypothetical protein